MAAVEPAPAMPELGTLLCESSFFSAPPTDTDAISSNAASLSSTPPTTVSPDSMSLASEPDVAAKVESVAESSIEAAVTLPEPEQHESRQETPTGQDAIVVADPLPATEPSSTTRPRRARSSLPVYNISKLIGTDIHGRRRSKGDSAQENRRHTTSDAALLNRDDNRAGDSIDALGAGRQSARGGGDASDTNRILKSLRSPRSARISKRAEPVAAQAHITRRATRRSGAPIETAATKLAALSKRGKKALDKGLGQLSRELKRLQDTDEFAHIDKRPVRYTVWSNGKYVDVDPAQEKAPEPPRKKAKVEDAKAADGAAKAGTESQESAAPAAKKRRVKKWLDKGLYAGQEAPVDIFKGLTAQEKKKLATLPELLPRGKPNKTLPQPMFNGLRLLIHGRDFKLPFDVCNPLPPGQPKPAAYRTMTRNRFVGDAAAYWKKTPHFEDFASKCVCKPEDGCGESCQNRIMLYECDETNCNVGKEFCQNRAFQDLQERTKKGGRYRIGVEVFKTADRGYGVRSNRCFEANQIIMEYTGEIITEEECERRMNEEYKDNECYYLMSFDQNMIIDATTGSIARFVNHSCSPNCRMIKWIVSGQPRMALFAGDRPIMTGEELTYDYNFDPFSAKNVQKCLCGSANCRGVLGPKPKEVKASKSSKDEKKPEKKPAKAISAKSPAARKTAGKTSSTKSSAAKNSSVRGASTKTGKRKLHDAFEFVGDDEEDAKVTKKRKVIKAATGVKRSLSSAGTKVAKGVAKGATKGKGAVATIKKNVSYISAGANKKKAALVSSKVSKAKAKAKVKTATASGRAGTGGKSGLVKASSAKKSATITTTSTTGSQRTVTNPSRSPSLTIVAAGVPAVTSAATSSSGSAKKQTPKKTAARTATAVSVSVSVTPVKTSSRKVTPSRKALESGLLEKKNKDGGDKGGSNSSSSSTPASLLLSTSAPKPTKSKNKVAVAPEDAGDSPRSVIATATATATTPPPTTIAATSTTTTTATATRIKVVSSSGSYGSN
ncbi:hypothetical protein VTK26DRAFT_9523 [Humicola hyalothermophila]